jgi:hypothetical protein
MALLSRDSFNAGGDILRRLNPPFLPDLSIRCSDFSVSFGIATKEGSVAIDVRRCLCDSDWMSGPAHSQDLERKRAVRLRLMLLVNVVAPWLVVLCCSCRTHSAATPKRASTLTQQVSLTGKAVPVDFYLPNGVSNAPVVVVAHGFTRSRLNMAGWGGLLASNGFIVAIPDLPALADYEQNSRAIRELLDVINKGEIAAEPRPAGGRRWWASQWADFPPCWRPPTIPTSAAG